MPFSPYKAVADSSFKTEMDSISSAEICATLPISFPSTKYKGASPVVVSKPSFSICTFEKLLLVCSPKPMSFTFAEFFAAASLVVTITTPFLPPTEPYKAVACAPFNTETLSIFSGGMELMSVTGTPSTIYSGSLSNGSEIGILAFSIITTCFVCWLFPVTFGSLVFSLPSAFNCTLSSDFPSIATSFSA